jgi:Mrp family chromosome partitioning ATPase
MARGTENGAAYPTPDDAASAITLLLSGATPANPPRVLNSSRAGEILDSVAATHDITIIDSAPLLSVTDSVPLMRYADSIIVVGRLSYTTRDTAKRLMEFLERIPDAHLIGVVANDLARLETMGYGYGAGYGYHVEPAKAKSKNVREPDRSDQRA